MNALIKSHCSPPACHDETERERERWREREREREGERREREIERENNMSEANAWRNTYSWSEGDLVMNLSIHSWGNTF